MQDERRKKKWRKDRKVAVRKEDDGEWDDGCWRKAERWEERQWME